MAKFSTSRNIKRLALLAIGSLICCCFVLWEQLSYSTHDDTPEKDDHHIGVARFENQEEQEIKQRKEGNSNHHPQVKIPLQNPPVVVCSHMTHWSSEQCSCEGAMSGALCGPGEGTHRCSHGKCSDAFRPLPTGFPRRRREVLERKYFSGNRSDTTDGPSGGDRTSSRAASPTRMMKTPLPIHLLNGEQQHYEFKPWTPSNEDEEQQHRQPRPLRPSTSFLPKLQHDPRLRQRSSDGVELHVYCNTNRFQGVTNQEFTIAQCLLMAYILNASRVVVPPLFHKDGADFSQIWDLESLKREALLFGIEVKEMKHSSDYHPAGGCVPKIWRWRDTMGLLARNHYPECCGLGQFPLLMDPISLIDNGIFASGDYEQLKHKSFDLMRYRKVEEAINEVAMKGYLPYLENNDDDEKGSASKNSGKEKKKQQQQQQWVSPFWPLDVYAIWENWLWDVLSSWGPYGMVQGTEGAGSRGVGSSPKRERSRGGGSSVENWNCGGKPIFLELYAFAFGSFGVYRYGDMLPTSDWMLQPSDLVRSLVRETQQNIYLGVQGYVGGGKGEDSNRRDATRTTATPARNDDDTVPWSPPGRSAKDLGAFTKYLLKMKRMSHHHQRRRLQHRKLQTTELNDGADNDNVFIDYVGFHFRYEKDALDTWKSVADSITDDKYTIMQKVDDLARYFNCSRVFVTNNALEPESNPRDKKFLKTAFASWLVAGSDHGRDRRPMTAPRRGPMLARQLADRTVVAQARIGVVWDPYVGVSSFSQRIYDLRCRRRAGGREGGIPNGPERMTFSYSLPFEGLLTPEC